jgi:hypothetical protein
MAIPINELSEALRQGDVAKYQSLRYPSIQDGEELAIIGEDFSNTDFTNFSLGFMHFVDCTLDKSKGFNGQPIIIENCSAKEIDLRDTYTVIEAKDTDFFGMLTDENTVLAIPENNSPSKFIRCIIDKVTKDYLVEQGVIISD